MARFAGYEQVEEVRFALFHGEIVELDGVRYRPLTKTLEPGDTYIAGRNTGPWVFTCKKIDHGGYAIATDVKAYPYRLSDCYPVEVVEDPPDVISHGDPVPW